GSDTLRLRRDLRNLLPWASEVGEIPEPGHGWERLCHDPSTRCQVPPSPPVVCEGRRGSGRWVRPCLRPASGPACVGHRDPVRLDAWLWTIVFRDRRRSSRRKLISARRYELVCSHVLPYLCLGLRAPGHGLISGSPSCKLRVVKDSP